MMFRKPFISLAFVTALIVAAQISVLGQSAPVSGTVELEKPDGTREPVANALIEVFRTDMKSGFPSAKTGKKGEFAFAGLPLGGRFAFSVSAPGCAPTILPEVKAGQEKLLITMKPGDGAKFSEAEVRAGASAKPGTGEPSAEQKKAKADYDKQVAEHNEKKKKVEEGDAVAKRSFDEGNAALKAQNYDLAIAKFDEGIAAVPDYVGSTPILLSGKMLALKNKGFNVYIEGAKSGDVAVKTAKYQEANKLYDDGLAAFQQALNVIKNAESAADAAETKRRENIRVELYAGATEIHRLKSAGSVDLGKGPEAFAIVSEYIAMEPDPARKFAAKLTLGDIMRYTGDFEKAVVAYKAVLEEKPDYPDALGSLGLTMYAQGVASTPEDKAKQQEGLNYMQKYTEVAPIAPTDSQPVKELKQSVKETVDYLKNQQKMTPQKLPPGRKRP